MALNVLDGPFSMPSSKNRLSVKGDVSSEKKKALAIGTAAAHQNINSKDTLVLLRILN